MWEMVSAWQQPDLLSAIATSTSTSISTSIVNTDALISGRETAMIAMEGGVRKFLFVAILLY